MIEIQTFRRARRIGGFCARHFLALVVTIAVPCVLWTIVYFGLLLWSAFSGGGMGSPAAYPSGLLLILVVGTAAGLVLFLPSTAIAEWFAQRRGIPILAQIPIAIAVLAFLCLMVGTIAVSLSAQPSVQGILVCSGILFAAHLLPLGVYWWTTQSWSVLLAVLQRLRSVTTRELSSIKSNA